MTRLRRPAFTVATILLASTLARAGVAPATLAPATLAPATLAPATLAPATLDRGARLRNLEASRRAIGRASRAHWVAPEVKAAIHDVHRRLGRLRTQHGGLQQAALSEDGGFILEPIDARVGSFSHTVKGSDTKTRGYAVSGEGLLLFTSFDRSADGSRAIYAVARERGEKLDFSSSFTPQPGPGRSRLDTVLRLTRTEAAAPATNGSPVSPNHKVGGRRRDANWRIPVEDHLAFVRDALSGPTTRHIRQQGQRILRRIAALGRTQSLGAVGLEGYDWISRRTSFRGDILLISTALSAGGRDLVSLTLRGPGEELEVQAAPDRVSVTKKRLRDGVQVHEQVDGHQEAGAVRVEAYKRVQRP